MMVGMRKLPLKVRKGRLKRRSRRSSSDLVQMDQYGIFLYETRQKRRRTALLFRFSAFTQETISSSLIGFLVELVEVDALRERIQRC